MLLPEWSLFYHPEGLVSTRNSNTFISYIFKASITFSSSTRRVQESAGRVMLLLRNVGLRTGEVCKWFSKHLVDTSERHENSHYVHQKNKTKQNKNKSKKRTYCFTDNPVHHLIQFCYHCTTFHLPQRYNYKTKKKKKHFS